MLSHCCLHFLSLLILADAAGKRIDLLIDRLQLRRQVYTPNTVKDRFLNPLILTIPNHLQLLPQLRCHLCYHLPLLHQFCPNLRSEAVKLVLYFIDCLPVDVIR